MKSRLAFAAALALGVILVAGCINYDQNMTLNADGSGVVTVKYNSDAQPGQEGVPALAFTEDAIKKEYEGAPFEVSNIVIGKKEGSESPEASYTIKFKNVTDLNGKGIFAPEGGKNLKQIFAIEKKGDLTTLKETVSFNMKVDDPSSLSGYKFTYATMIPNGEIVETNGTKNGNQVKWEYTLDKLINKDTEMTVTYKTGKKFPIGIVIGVVVALLVIIVIIIIIIVVAAGKKKKKPAAGGASA